MLLPGAEPLKRSGVSDLLDAMWAPAIDHAAADLSASRTVSESGSVASSAPTYAVPNFY